MLKNQVDCGIRSRRGRRFLWYALCAAALSACCTFAAHNWIKRRPAPPVLPWTGLVVYLNGLMGLPDPPYGDPYFAVNEFRGEPRFDAFCRVAIEKAKPYIRDSSLPYEVWMIPFNKYEVRGWPFVSMQKYTDVVIDDPPGPMARRWNQHTIRIAEDGSSPLSWSGLIGNWAVFLLPSLVVVWLGDQALSATRRDGRLPLRWCFVLAAGLSAGCTFAAHVYIQRAPHPPALPWKGSTVYLNGLLDLSPPQREDPYHSLNKFAGDERFDALCRVAAESARPYIRNPSLRYVVEMIPFDMDDVRGWPIVSRQLCTWVWVREFALNNESRGLVYGISITEEGSSPLSWIGLIGNWCFYLVPCFLITWLTSRAISALWRRLTREPHGFPVIMTNGDEIT